VIPLLTELEGGRTINAARVYGEERLRECEARVTTFTVGALGPGAIAALERLTANEDARELSRRVFLMASGCPLLLLRHVSRGGAAPIFTAMREMLGRLDEDGVVGEGDWQWRPDFVSEVLALLALPRSDPLVRADTAEDVADAPEVDDDVLGGDDGVGKVVSSYNAWVAGRKDRKRPKRQSFRGSRDKRRRAKAANGMRDAREEAARQTEARCTKTRANHFAWVMLIAGSSYHTLMMVGSFLGVWVPPQSTGIHHAEGNDRDLASTGDDILRTPAGVPPCE
jgi:hypothetical protein